MTWINEHKRTWRLVVLGLLLVALAGPWAFEKISVPAEYPCSPPNVRLQGDFCGLLFSGIKVFAWTVSGFFSMIARLFTGAVDQADLFRGALVFSFLLVLLLPFFTTLFLTLRRNGFLMLHSIVWGLAIGASLFLGLSFLASPHPALWGLWLYVGLAVGALLLELLAFLADRKDTTNKQRV